MHGWIFWIIVGIIAGALAKSVVPGEAPGGLLVDFIVGIIGAVLGGWLFSHVGIALGNGPIGTTIVAFIGAVILLLIVRAVTGRRTTRTTL